MSSFVALLADDLEKHVQLNCARLNSCGVLREEIKTYFEWRGPLSLKREAEMLVTRRRRRPDGHRCVWQRQAWQGQRQREKGTARTARTGQGHGQEQGFHEMLELTKPANAEPKVEIGEFDMSCLDGVMHFNSRGLNGSRLARLESTQVQERRHGPRVSHTGRSFLAMLTSLSAQQLESLSSLVSDCTLKVATIGESISMFEVFKRRCANHCCLLEGTRRWVELLSCMVTKVTCSTKVRMLRRKWMHGEGDERFTILRLYSCVQREQRVQHLHETERKEY